MRTRYWWLVALVLVTACSKQPVHDPRVDDLRKELDSVRTELAAYKSETTKTFEGISKTKSILIEIEKARAEKEAKPKRSAGVVDCWTDRQGYRNCTDANGNSSRRNF